jgi:glutamate-ammonia-ligase adenylyltransferase
MDGSTSGGPASISNEQFMNEVAQRLLGALCGGPSSGPLYVADTRLRPHGASGPLVPTLSAFEDYYREAGQTWERMSLTRARVIFASDGFGECATLTVRSILSTPVDQAALASDVLAMRKKLEAARPRRDLKRGAGGLADVEFIVQYLQLRHASDHPDLLQPNVWDALTALGGHGIISPAVHDDLREAYEFLRTVEGRLRLVHNRSVSVLPVDGAELDRLSRRLSEEAADPARDVGAFLAEVDGKMIRTREIFDEIVGRSVSR